MFRGSGARMRATVDVYHVADGRRQVLRLRSNEANVLIALGKARKRERQKDAITLLISIAACWAFVYAMRQRAREHVTGIDSRTHKRLPGPYSYIHVRNNAYSPDNRRLQ
jgi:hypothetical protein